MLNQQLLGAEPERTLAGDAIGTSINRCREAIIAGQGAGRAFDPRAIGGMIEQRAQRAPVLD